MSMIGIAPHQCASCMVIWKRCVEVLQKNIEGTFCLDVEDLGNIRITHSAWYLFLNTISDSRKLVHVSDLKLYKQFKAWEQIAVPYIWCWDNPIGNPSFFETTDDLISKIHEYGNLIWKLSN